MKTTPTYSDIAEALCVAYGMELETVQNYIANSVHLDGVRSDVIKKALAAEKLTYRSWFDGGGTDGPLAARWEIDVWPTLVLIDARGVVRDMAFGWPERKDLGAAIDKVLKGAGKK